MQQAVATILPPKILVSACEKVAGVGNINLPFWARWFVQDVQHLREDGRKVLLIFDGYRSHMSVAALRVLRKGAVISSSLPAHTGGTTQPLDLTVFSYFFWLGLRRLADPSRWNVYDVFDLC